VTTVHSPLIRLGRDGNMVFDQARGVSLLFAGYNDPVETWTYDGVDWLQLRPMHSPDIRVGSVMTYDSLRQRVLAIGGRGEGGGFLDDVWEFDGADWSALRPAASLGGLRASAAIFDPRRGEVVVFSGHNQLAVGADSLFKGLRALRSASPTSTAENCLLDRDGDGDGLVGCADPDCWSICTPTCPPKTSCDAPGPRCGDGVCQAPRENFLNCSDCSRL
jgi:hypothetical protein